MPSGSGAVVIDTLRFTTTAAQAKSAGCKSICIVQEIETARALATDRQLLCGERYCRPIPGFAMGNSPLEYTPHSVAGRELVFSTTNGTRAVQAAQLAPVCLLGSLVNRAAVSEQILASSIRHWKIICAGTDGQVAGEDLLAAGAMLAWLSSHSHLTLENDSAELAVRWWNSLGKSPSHQQLELLLRSFVGGRNLVEAGYEQDIRFASNLDSIAAVPQRNADPLFV